MREFLKLLWLKLASAAALILYFILSLVVQTKVLGTTGSTLRGTINSGITILTLLLVATVLVSTRKITQSMASILLWPFLWIGMWVWRVAMHPVVYFCLPAVIVLLWSIQDVFGFHVDSSMVAFCALYIFVGRSQLDRENVRAGSIVYVLLGLSLSLGVFMVGQWSALSPRAGSILLLNLALFCVWNGLAPSRLLPGKPEFVQVN